MNDQIPAGRSGPPSRRSAPPARPIWRSAPGGCLLLGSTRLRAELGGAAKEGAGGRLQTAPATEGPLLFPFLLQGALPLARECRRSHSGPATVSRSCPFARRSRDKGREEGCWSWGRPGAAGTWGRGRAWSRARGARGQLQPLPGAEDSPSPIFPSLWAQSGWRPLLTPSRGQGSFAHPGLTRSFPFGPRTPLLCGGVGGAQP